MYLLPHGVSIAASLGTFVMRMVYMQLSGSMHGRETVSKSTHQ